MDHLEDESITKEDQLVYINRRITALEQEIKEIEEEISKKSTPNE